MANISVLHNIVFALRPNQARFFGLGFAAGFNEFFPVDDFSAEFTLLHNGTPKTILLNLNSRPVQVHEHLFKSTNIIDTFIY